MPIEKNVISILIYVILCLILLSGHCLCLRRSHAPPDLAGVFYQTRSSSSSTDFLETADIFEYSFGIGFIGGRESYFQLTYCPAAVFGQQRPDSGCSIDQEN